MLCQKEEEVKRLSIDFRWDIYYLHTCRRFLNYIGFTGPFGSNYPIELASEDKIWWTIFCFVYWSEFEGFILSFRVFFR